MEAVGLSRSGWLAPGAVELEPMLGQRASVELEAWVVLELAPVLMALVVSKLV